MKFDKDLFKKIPITNILIFITLLLFLWFLLLPSKNKINEIKVKKIEKTVKTLEVSIYTTDFDLTKIIPYKFSLKEDTSSNILKNSIIYITNKYSEDSKKEIKLINVFFGENSIYYEFDEKNLDPIFIEAVSKTTENLSGITDIKFI